MKMKTRKLLPLALFCLLSCLLTCLLTTAGFGSASLVQANAGGFFSGSVASGAIASTTAVGFTGATGMGNLLVSMVYAVGANAANYEIDAPTVGGGYSGSWTQLNGSEWTDGANIGKVLVMYIPNAPVMSTSQFTTATIKNHHLVVPETLSIEFDLYEFSGVTATVNEVLDSNDLQTGGTPGGTFGFSTADTNLIIAAFAAKPGGNISAGSGYTLGIDATTVTVGQMMYQLNAAPGKTGVSFGSGTEPYWGCSYTSFQVASSPPPPSSVPRHRGFVN